jgi:predicted nucleic acid-binding Zn finger protein
MTLRELEKRLDKLHELMDGAIDGIESDKAQEEIFKFLYAYVNNFDQSNGNFTLGQDYTAKFLYIQRKITEILSKEYTPSVYKYLSVYQPIQDEIVTLNKSYNDLKIDVEKLDPARKAMYNQAKYFLLDGINDNYVQPVKYLLMQQVTQGSSIEKSRNMLSRWKKGKISAGSVLNSGRATPNLEQYATQIARDTMYGYYGTTNEVISTEYGLECFIYTGDIIKDSRPFCRHVVGLRRKINIDEVPKLIVKYPDGIKPNTTKENFLINRGGYSCRHGAFAVKC